MFFQNCLSVASHFSPTLPPVAKEPERYNLDPTTLFFVCLWTKTVKTVRGPRVAQACQPHVLAITFQKGGEPPPSKAAWPALNETNKGFSTFLCLCRRTVLSSEATPCHCCSSHQIPTKFYFVDPHPNKELKVFIVKVLF